MTSRGTIDGATRWLWFLAWALVGLLGAFGIAALLTIGVFVLPVALLLAVVLVAVRDARRSAWGLGLGAAALVAWLAYLNRHGPGTYCTLDADGSGQCDELYSPWPFVVVAVVFTVAAVAGQVWADSRAGRVASGAA